MAMYPCLSLPSLSFPSVSGAVCSFDSQYAGLPLKAHTVAVTATQSGSGTPSPDNVRTINGVSAIHIQNTAGINQWDEQWRTGYYSGADGIYNPQNNTICSLGRFRCTPNTSYYIYSGSLNVNVMFYDENDNFLSYYYHANGNAITTPNNCYWLRWTADFGSGNTYNNDISINYPSTDTSYHAFVGQSITVQIGSTIYGGNYDAVSGVLTVDKGYSSNNGSEGWTVQEENDDLIVFRLNNAVASILNEFAQISNIFSYDANAWRVAYGSGNTFVQGASRTLFVKCFKSDFADITAFKTFLGNTNLQYVYNVSPQTIQLPPCPIETLSVNNVFADTGDTTLQYIKLG